MIITYIAEGGNMNNSKFFWECTFGKKSHMNLAGKIIFAPFIIMFGVIWLILDLLFTK